MDAGMNVTLRMLHQTMNLGENQTLVRVKTSREQVPGVIRLQVQDLQILFLQRAAKYNRMEQIGQLKKMFSAGEVQVLEGNKLMLNKNFADKLHGSKPQVVAVSDTQTEVAVDFDSRADFTDELVMEMLDHDLEESSKEPQKPSEMASHAGRHVSDLPKEAATQSSGATRTDRGEGISVGSQERRILEQRLEHDRKRLQRDRSERRELELREDKERAREIRREAQYGKGPIEKVKASESSAELGQAEKRKQRKE